MSYYRTFKPTEEAMKRYKTYDSSDFGEVAKTNLLIYCLKPIEGDDIYNEYRSIKTQLSFLENSEKNSVYQDVSSKYKTDGTVWFQGWQFANEPDNDKDTLYSNTIKQLLLLKNIATPDYFENNQKYLDKVSAIEEQIDYFTDDIYTINQFAVIDELKAFEENDDYTTENNSTEQ